MKIASPDIQNGQAAVTYEIVGEQEVSCEIDEAVYRAEQRFGDMAALLIESIGKKAVVETLCDIFIASFKKAQEIWLHHDDLDSLLYAERMVAASTTRQTLGYYSFFAQASNDYWRLDAPRLLDYVREEVGGEPDLVKKWCNVTSKLLDERDLLADTRIKLPFNRLRTALEKAETQRTDEPVSLIEQLNRDETNDYLQQQVAEEVKRYATYSGSNEADSKLHEIIANASDDVWDVVLRDVLHKTIETLRKGNNYARAAYVAKLWSDHDVGCRVNVQEITNEAEAWEWIDDPMPDVETVLLAIELAPTITKAYETLHTSVQHTLQQYPARHWRDQAQDSQQAVLDFYEHIQQVEEARKKLRPNHQQAFDTTVKTCAHDLWAILPENQEESKLYVLLALPKSAPTARLENQHIEYIVSCTQNIQQAQPIAALLLASIVWELLPSSDTYFRPQVADILVHCHDRLEIWELTNNKDWREVLASTWQERLRQKCRQHSDTHIEREEAFLKTLQQPAGDTLLDILLIDERERWQEHVEQSIQRTLKSLA